MIVISLYVDNILLTEENSNIILWMKCELNSRFEMENLGEADLCLSLKISQTGEVHNLFLVQRKCTEVTPKRIETEQGSVLLQEWKCNYLIVSHLGRPQPTQIMISVVVYRIQRRSEVRFTR